MLSDAFSGWAENKYCLECLLPNAYDAKICSSCGAELTEPDLSPAGNTNTRIVFEDISPSNPLVVRGHNGQIVFDGKSVAISRKGALGFLSQGLKGIKEIPLRAISSIQLKKAGMFTNGYIQFATGAGESAGGLKAAVTDENTVMFTNLSNEDFEELRSFVTQAMHEPNRPTATTTSSAEQLEKLANLLDKGLLTEAEFLAEKKRILG